MDILDYLLLMRFHNFPYAVRSIPDSLTRIIIHHASNLNAPYRKAFHYLVSVVSFD